jgi:hypothetical protein
LANVQFYINGVLAETSTIGRTSQSGNPARMFIGTGSLTTRYYNGGIDELHIYNEVVDAATIAGLAVVPEPSAIVLVVSGLACVGWGARRRRGGNESQ